MRIALKNVSCHPTIFNHNAVFHVIVSLALLLQLFAEFVPPESEIEESDEEDLSESSPLIA